MLTDAFGRRHDYLRISLTDACNFRCTYCMPEENIKFMPSQRLMQVGEIEAIAGMFVKMGVQKIRLTGGEPLVRKDAAAIIKMLSGFGVELTITTNGTLVHDYIDIFKEAGIRSINLSLDTLNREKFASITQRNQFDKVWDNIHLLIEKGFHVKVNAVVMKGVNDMEILDFVAWTRDLPVHVRFIEFMPFTGNLWDHDKVFSLQEMLVLIGSEYSFVKLGDHPNDTAKKYKVLNHEGTFAVISTMSAPFCSTCNRMRLTADGKMKNCLFSKTEIDLLGAYRAGQDLEPLVKQCVAEKAEALGGQFTSEYMSLDATHIENRSMIQIGG